MIYGFPLMIMGFPWPFLDIIMYYWFSLTIMGFHQQLSAFNGDYLVWVFVIDHRFLKVIIGFY